MPAQQLAACWVGSGQLGQLDAFRVAVARLQLLLLASCAVVSGEALRQRSREGVEHCRCTCCDATQDGHDSRSLDCAGQEVRGRRLRPMSCIGKQAVVSVTGDGP